MWGRRLGRIELVDMEDKTDRRMFDIDKIDLRNKGSVKMWEKNIDIRYNNRWEWYRNTKLRTYRMYIDNIRQSCSILESKAWYNTESKAWRYIETRRGWYNGKSAGWRKYIENRSRWNRSPRHRCPGEEPP